MVFYRKYRPQKIEELDSKEVRDKLYSVFKTASLSPHAFLFTGPKGLGKTSTARIVAKVLNCEQITHIKSHVANKKEKKSTTYDQQKANGDIEPCNKCDQCIAITNGASLDILEIDGASNRGIDEIRDLREKVKLMPANARKKVYIIDEVHMLTTEAFNALLKTLEEPPSHVVFILCTTEPHKVPSTILSRCFHIQFQKATKEELVRSFERIIKSEKLKADKDALDLIASFSDGSFRDGVKILEEMVLVLSGETITRKLVENNYKIVNIDSKVKQMIQNLENKDTKKGLKLVSVLFDEGVEMEYFLKELIRILHEHLLYKIGITDRPMAEKLEIEDTKKLIELLSKAYLELKYAVLPQLPLEMAIVEWRNWDLPSFTNVQETIVSKSRLHDSPPKVTQQNIGTYSKNGALWNALIDKVKTYNHSIAGVLRGCSIKSYDDKSLIIETSFKFHKERLEEIKTHEILEKTCKEITKKNVRIEVLLKKPA